MSKNNPVVYFEIPVIDLDRAESFYGKVFQTKFSREKVLGYEMATFPFDDQKFGACGGLVKGDVYKPTTDGVILYFRVEDIDKTLDMVVNNGGKIFYTKRPNATGFIAEFKDSEGNRIALNQVSR
jgi:predicted enzyme related to lactoylglutathione lyase